MATLLFEEGHAEPKPVQSAYLKKQLLNNVVDGMAATRPKALFAELPVSPTNFEAGYRKVTYRALANAINGAAWWLIRKLGGPGKDFQTISYMGWNDIRYVIFLLGAVKAGYKVSFSPSRSSKDALTSVLLRIATFDIAFQ